MGAQAIAHSFLSTIGIDWASESSKLGVSLEEAAAILGHENVFDKDACIQVLGTGQKPSQVPAQVPFSTRQLRKLAVYGRPTLFLRYASCNTVQAASVGFLKINQSVMELVSLEDRKTAKVPTYRLVLSDLQPGDEVNLRRIADDIGVRLAAASITTASTALLLRIREEQPPVGIQSLGRIGAVQVIVAHGKEFLEVRPAQRVASFPTIFEVRARG